MSDKDYVISRKQVRRSSTDNRFERLLALPKGVTVWRIHNLGPDAIEWADMEKPTSEGDGSYTTLVAGQSEVPLFTPEAVYARRTNDENESTLLIIYTTSTDAKVIARVAAANLSGGSGGGGGGSGDAALEPLSGRPRHVQVNIGTSQVALISGLASGMAAVTLYNRSSNTIFLGGSGVTSGTGYPVPANSPFSADVDETVPLFGIAGIGTSNDVRILGFGG